MTKRKRKKSRRSRSRPSSLYRRRIRQADEVMAQNGVDEIGDDNWQTLVLEWCTPAKPDRDTMARFIARHEGKLGAGWAREMLRLDVYFHFEDHEQIIEHHRRALSRYPRCALVELWVADQVFRCAGDFWRARPMYQYVIEHLPEHPKPYYEMGYMSYVLGDFQGALDWFDRAAQRVTGAYDELAARVFFNRGIVRYSLDGDRQTVIADIKKALRCKRDYVQARQMLRALRSGREMRFVPW